MSHLGGNDQPGSVGAAEFTTENVGPRPEDTTQSTKMNQPTVHIPQIVARATGRSVFELPPLQHAIDGDALDILIATSSEEAPVQITFDWAECTVTVASAATVEVTVNPHS